MSEDAKPLDLEVIEARSLAATDPPWAVGRNGDRFRVVAMKLGYKETEVCQISPWEPSTDEPDAVFIAHAREDVPALIAEVRRLRAALEGLVEFDSRAGRDSQLVGLRVTPKYAAAYRAALVALGREKP